MKARDRRWWFAIFVVAALLLSVRSEAAQKDLQKLTVGYTPICFAVFRLITNSNFIGCSTGRSAGLAPFRIRST